MTKWTKPVTRETESMERGEPIAATLHARYVEVWIKGTRQKVRMSYDAIFWAAIKREKETEQKTQWRRAGLLR